MLDDLYTLPEVDDDAPDDSPTRAPSWSSAEALDEAFASWVPGPADGATALERSMVAGVSGDAGVDHGAPIEQWLVESEPIAPEPVPAGMPRWSPRDDDILPTRRRPRGRRG